ncbi:hypothetical protein TW81_09735 [Vibrio galatheae]|uniref:Phage tail protein n=1 Tax=Vibrio galatheae TaxID=579748 RepID=A0A0F4NJB2_9VIBR|nr:contractile injection system protein, VgrG/Pvc8 family [Vibrio galatheae]KJY83275.1 hypothetical protein TW81_09735 [Vibrio galatheae]
MVNDVRTPMYAIYVNNEDVTANVTPHFSELSLTDNHKDEADDLTLTLSSKFQRPAYKDEIKVFLGYEEEEKVEFFGLFYVQSTSVRNNRVLTINATSVDFNSRLKERRSQTYETPLDQVISDVANRNSLALRAVITDAPLTHYEQNNESDLAFVQRLAKEHNAIFNIKNATLYFVQGEQEVPKVELDIDECFESDITYSNTSTYGSAQAMFQDTKQNKAVTARVGEGEPVLVVKGHWETYEEAEQAAKQALERANAEQAEGICTIAGRRIFAGSHLDLADDSFSISKVTHTVNKAWKSQITFNNKFTV